MSARGLDRFAIACVLAALALSGAVSANDAISGSPFAPRSGPRGATMFAEMDPAHTGIVVENNFADPKMWGEHYLEFTLGSVGTGIAIGDYDGDGRPDILVVSKTEQSRLFRNLGGWRFEDVTAEAGLEAAQDGWLGKAMNLVGLGGGGPADSPHMWKQGASFVDVNNDGRLDIYICRFDAPNLLYMNLGDGAFREEAAARGLAVVDASGVGAFCDFDRDGWLDVFVTTNLLDASLHPNGQRGYLFRNKGDGTFTDVTDATGIRGEMQSHAATWWDYDEDGWPDLHVANDFAGPDLLYRNNRDPASPGFTNVIGEVVPQMPYSAMGADLGDVNNDGRIDLLVADMAASSHERDHRGMAYARGGGNTLVRDPAQRPQSSRNMLYLATGTGRVQEAAFLAGLAKTDWTWSTRLEDLDNDGRLDLFVTNGMVRECQNADLLERLMGAGSLEERISIMRSSPKLTETTLAFRNLGDLRFDETGAAWGLRRRGVSFGAALGDLDGDGDLDLVYSNYEGNVTVLRNDSDSGHRAIVALRGRATLSEALSLSKGTRSNRFGVGARVRIESRAGVQVRELVVARGYLSSSEPVLHFGLGDDERIDRLTVQWPGGATQTFTDLPAGRRYTITEPEAPPVPATAAPVRAMFSPVANAPAFEPGDPRVAVADFNRDGRPDRFVGAAALHGDVEIAGKSALFVARGAGYEDETDAIAPGLRDVGLVLAAVWSDADLDGWHDLLVALKWGEVKFFHNVQGQRLVDETVGAGFASAGPGWWSALAAGEFNGDGRPDYVAGNLGLNTQYTASPAHPALVLLGDFSGKGTMQAIEAYHQGDSLYPWRNRKEIGSIVPDVLKRYPRNNAFARATLPEILGEERMAAARRFAATEFRSGVFLSRPDGTWRFEPFPRIAQIAPVQGAAVADFDGDGHTDIYLAQNRRAVAPSFGNFDGGLSQLLLGDGRGGLVPVPPLESGMIVQEHTSAVAVRDLDGNSWPDVVVARADGSTVAFRNNGVPGRRPPGLPGDGKAGK